MFKPLNIIFGFLLILIAFPANAEDNFRVFVPEFIPMDASFEVSIITSKNYPDADKLDIYFFPDFSLLINDVELRTEKGEYQLPLSSEFVKNFSEISQKVSIDLKDTSILSADSFFEIIIHLKSQNTNANYLKFYSEFIGGNKILGHLVSSNENIITDQPELYKLTFNYFEKYYTAEFAGKFSRDSFLNIPLAYNFYENLVAEFWIKFKNYNSTFLDIIDWETDRVDYFLSLNENQMLAVNSRLNDIFQLKPSFISSNCWYHLTIIFNKNKSQLSFLCNDDEFANLRTSNHFNFNNLLFHFKNVNSSGSYSIDQFRIISDNGSLAGIDKNKNYFSYSDDSSSVLLQVNFSESELGKLLNEKTISYEGIKFVKSNAPIFPRAPQVDVKILNNFFEVDWTGGDFKNAAYYLLEKATGNNNFEEVNRLSVDNNEEKNYSLLVEKPVQSEILYFRIKQVNKDGSAVYSDVVKVGQGTVQDVILGQNYPNPFNPTTTIKFELLQDTDVEVKVFNLEGKEVAQLYKGFLNHSIYQFEFDAKGLPSGIYIYQVKTPFSISSQKMIFTK